MNKGFVRQTQTKTFIRCSTEWCNNIRVIFKIRVFFRIGLYLYMLWKKTIKSVHVWLCVWLCVFAALTYNLDDVGQQDAVRYVRLQVCDQSLVPWFGQVVIGPVRVDLTHKKIQMKNTHAHRNKFRSAQHTDTHTIKKKKKSCSCWGRAGESPAFSQLCPRASDSITLHEKNYQRSWTVASWSFLWLLKWQRSGWVASWTGRPPSFEGLLRSSHPDSPIVLRQLRRPIQCLLVRG